MKCFGPHTFLTSHCFGQIRERDMRLGNVPEAVGRLQQVAARVAQVVCGGQEIVQPVHALRPQA